MASIVTRIRLSSFSGGAAVLLHHGTPPRGMLAIQRNDIVTYDKAPFTFNGKITQAQIQYTK
jgi:hypothetical protein